MSAVPRGLDEWLQHNERSTFTPLIDVAQTLVTDTANKAKDKADEELDAKRVHDGMTLDEFLAKK